ncbi:MAG: phage Gp37/Gp68 family protein [Armatimonadetes bacterium]|nr:phage Gp37/Gp68 family protein [Armatimonadota bacterium]MBM3738930.1 phage Gp37/Gp68 family protein [Acidobacteriota bacterium]
MAETSKIAWTDSTFNPVIGCTKVGPGCDHCYAEAMDSRKRWGGVVHWGPGTPRQRTSASNWKQPLAWNRKAAASGKPWRVFCASLADVFDNEWPDGVREDLFRLIEQTPALTWLLLTKRIGNASDMMFRARGGHLPLLPNVWLGATIVNQEEADRDIPKLLSTPARVRFVSYEPALEPVDWTQITERIAASSTVTFDALHEKDKLDRGTWRPRLDWIIVGGESGPNARPFNIAWARYTIAQCRAAGVACFVKQLGAHVITNGIQDAGDWWPRQTGLLDTGKGYFRKHLVDRAGADPAEWPENFRIQEFPLL